VKAADLPKDGAAEDGGSPKSASASKQKVNKVLGEYGKSKSLLHDTSSKVEIFMKLAELPRPGNYYIVVYTRLGSDKTWSHVITTEHNEEVDVEVSFNKAAKLRFMMQTQRFMRFEVYKLKDREFKEDLTKQKFIGSFNCTLIEVLLARGRPGTGWFIMDLVHPKKGTAAQGKLGAFGEEDNVSKQQISFDCSCTGVPSADTWKRRADSFIVINRQQKKAADADDGKEETDGTEGKDGKNAKDGKDAKDCKLFAPVLRTEVVRASKMPKWERVYLMAEHLWPKSDADDVLLEVHDWFRVAKPGLIGETWLRFREVDTHFRNTSELTLAVLKPAKKGTHIPPGSTKVKAGMKLETTE